MQLNITAQENTFVSCHKRTTYVRQTLASLLYYLTRQSTVSNRAITLFYQQGFTQPCIVVASRVKGKVSDATENKTRSQLNFQTVTNAKTGGAKYNYLRDSRFHASPPYDALI